MLDVLSNPLGMAQNAGPEVIQQPTPEQQSDIAGQWRNWFADSNNRAALMQFGVSMMQPVGLGQSPAGHIGQALGQTGEALTRRSEFDRKDRELESKDELRGAQATLAESRAATAGAGAGRAADRLAFERERFGFQRQRYQTSDLIRLQQQFIRDKQKHEENMAVQPAASRTPFPNFDAWVAQNPSLARSLDLGGTSASTDPNDVPAGGGDTAAPPVAGGPRVGEVRRGYRFRGGDPGNESSWEKVR